MTAAVFNPHTGSTEPAGTPQQRAEPLENPDLRRALKEMSGAAEGYEDAEKYYENKVAEVFASPKLRRALERTGLDYKFNFAKTPVDAVSDRMSLTGVTEAEPDADPDADGDGAESPVTQAVQQLFDDNDLDLEIPDWICKTLEYGDGYVVVWPAADDVHQDQSDTEGEQDGVVRLPLAEAPDADGRPQRVDMFFNSPKMCRVFYDEDNPRRRKFAIRRWREADGRWRVDLLYRDRIEPYISRAKAETSGGHASAWVQYTDDSNVDEETGQGIWPLPNPFGELPVFHLRTARPYGRPEHRYFYGPQNAINKLIIGHLSGVDFHTLSQRYGLLEKETDSTEAANMDADEFNIDPTAEDGDGEDQQSSLSAEPGSLWQLRGYKAIGEFTPSPPEVFLTPMQRYLEFGAQITTTPLRMFLASGLQPSGDSQRMSEAPFTKKVNNRCDMVGASLRDIFEFAVSILLGYRSRLMVHWAPVQVIDDQAGWSVLAAKQAAGVPKEQTLTEAGYTPEQTKAWFEDLDEESLRRLDYVVRVAEVVQQLAGAVSMGALSPEQSTQLVDQVLGEAGGSGD